MNEEIQCFGCGVMLQSENADQPGYLPANRRVATDEQIWCQRCFRIRHYNEIAPVSIDADQYLRKLASIAQHNALVVQVIDLFDFSGSMIPGLHRHIGKNPLLLIANKVDLFPRSTKWEKLKNWLLQACAQEHLRPVDIVLGSAEKGYQSQEVMQAIEHYRQGRDVFLVGTANVGKSTWVNRMLFEGGIQESITTSPYPGTTLDFIEIPLEDGSKLIDTPGLLKTDRMSERLQPEELKIVLPKERIKPKVYQLNPQQTLFLGGLVRMDFVSGERQSFICYGSNRLLIHRTKWENADKFHQKHLGTLLQPPKNADRFTKWHHYTFHFTGAEKRDIVIAGLGFITTGKKPSKIMVKVPEGIQVVERASII